MSRTVSVNMPFRTSGTAAGGGPKPRDRGGYGRRVFPVSMLRSVDLFYR